jgi:hypothetical protein
MERMTRRVRQTRMMDQRPLRGPAGFFGLLGVLGVLGTGLLVVALSGCGSVVASDGAATPAAAAATTAAPVGCASVNLATAVSIRRMMHLMAPVGTNPVSTATYRHPAQVRALFGQLCAAVTHPAPLGVMHCPADFGTEFVGTFYDGSRVLATFTYAPTGCARASVTAAGKTLATMVYGRAATAAPHLATDLAAIVGSPGVAPQQGEINPGGPDKPA